MTVVRVLGGVYSTVIGGEYLVISNIRQAIILCTSFHLFGFRHMTVRSGLIYQSKAILNKTS